MRLRRWLLVWRAHGGRRASLGIRELVGERRQWRSWKVHGWGSGLHTLKPQPDRGHGLPVSGLMWANRREWGASLAVFCFPSLWKEAINCDYVFDSAVLPLRGSKVALGGWGALELSSVYLTGVDCDRLPAWTGWITGRPRYVDCVHVCITRAVLWQSPPVSEIKSR